MKRKGQEMRLVGGPKDGTTTTIYTAYLDNDAKPVNNQKGDEQRRSGKVGLYYNRGTHYEWNGREG